MMAGMSWTGRVAFAVGVASLVLAGGSCVRRLTIREIRDQAAQLVRDKAIVRAEGTVAKEVSVPVALVAGAYGTEEPPENLPASGNVSVFELDDGTGTIWVISSVGGYPTGTQARVKARVERVSLDVVPGVPLSGVYLVEEE
jgi:hypothetical protein